MKFTWNAYKRNFNVQINHIQNKALKYKDCCNIFFFLSICVIINEDKKEECKITLKQTH